jgi:TRAP-type C4-dicarboxylate transport system permease small subunit
MTGTAILKKTGSIILDTLEIYIPTLAFSVMFLVFIIQVFYRYFLNNPLTWPPEIISMTFIWTTVLGACYAQRTGEHVAFSLLYDRASAKVQLAMRLLGNGLIAIIFLIALKPAFDYVTFMSFRSSIVLKIPFSVIYFPFVIFLVLIIGRMLHAVFVDINRIINKQIEKDVSGSLQEGVTTLLLDEETP